MSSLQSSPNHIYVDSLEELNELTHYGVKGMKWGVRRSDDEIAAAKAKRIEVRDAKREVRGKKQDALAAAFSTKISEIDKKSYETNFERQTAMEQRAGLVKKRDRALKDAERVREGKLTIKQRNLLVGAGVAATLVAAHAAWQFQDSGEINRRRLVGKAKAEGHDPNSFDPIFSRKFGLSRKDMSEDEIFNEVVSKINPGYGGYGTKMNCRRATFAYEMRRRGYDVKATKSAMGTGQHGAGLYNAVTPGSKRIGYSTTGAIIGMSREAYENTKGKGSPMTDFVTSKGVNPRQKPVSLPGMRGSIFEHLSQYPDGARGELGVMWKIPAGHSMAWEIVRGKPVIFDAQTGQRYNSVDSKGWSAMESMIGSANTVRLDDIDLNPEILMRWLTNA